MKACLGRVLQECREATGPAVVTRHDFGLCARGPRLLAPPGSHWPVEKRLMGEDCTFARWTYAHYFTFVSEPLEFKENKIMATRKEKICILLWHYSLQI